MTEIEIHKNSYGEKKEMASRTEMFRLAMIQSHHFTFNIHKLYDSKLLQCCENCAFSVHSSIEAAKVKRTQTHAYSLWFRAQSEKGKENTVALYARLF